MSRFAKKKAADSGPGSPETSFRRVRNFNILRIKMNKQDPRGFLQQKASFQAKPDQISKTFCEFVWLSAMWATGIFSPTEAASRFFGSICCALTLLRPLHQINHHAAANSKVSPDSSARRVDEWRMEEETSLCSQRINIWLCGCFTFTRRIWWFMRKQRSAIALTGPGTGKVRGSRLPRHFSSSQLSRRSAQPSKRSHGAVGPWWYRASMEATWSNRWSDFRGFLFEWICF